MNVEQAVDIVRESLLVMLMLSAPVLLAGLCIGLVISILQAVTQIQEQTLTFVPKIIGMAIAAIIIAPWVATQLIEYSQKMFGG